MMKTLLITTLEKLGYPVFLQGQADEHEEYSESYITFLTIDSPDNSHFDNMTTSWAWRFQVTFYSVNPALVETVPNEIRAAMKEAGFIPDGKGRDLPGDDDEHTGWTQDYYKIEYGRM